VAFDAFIKPFLYCFLLTGVFNISVMLPALLLPPLEYDPFLESEPYFA
jgi:hypothetical protein